MKRHSFLFSVLSAFLLSLSSCEGDQTVHYAFTDLDLAHLNTSAGMPFLSSDSVPKTLYGIRLSLHPQEISRKGRYFDPNESSVVNDNPITLFKVWSDSTFMGQTPGTILNDHFMHFPGSYLHAERIEIGGSIEPTARYSPDYENNNFPLYTDVLLISDPNPGAYKFFIELTLENGSIFTDSTLMVKLY